MSIFSMNICKGEKDTFLRDWSLIGEVVRSKCYLSIGRVRKVEGEKKVPVLVSITDTIISSIFAQDIVGKKGFLTGKGWVMQEHQYSTHPKTPV